ncbi:hypothetical protein KKF91_02495 [Myxococcota bacterium]|nr:hypothetical protein [Myxococcota bacterium]MBU1429409.1 hypothetical protein [Myxococcota bacterium]MBU1900381.1 hypothetical protein [Myxococcota bacterium]
MQNHLCQIIAYVIALYWEHPKHEALFTDFTQVIQALQSLAVARNRRAALPPQEITS